MMTLFKFILVLLLNCTILSIVNSIIKRVCQINSNQLKDLVHQNIFDHDVKIFEEEYQKNFDEKVKSICLKKAF